jgi:hypothetical protein
MDLLRSCYKSKMRLYRDRPDILVEGQWRFCLPDAEPVPFPHSFGSHTQDPEGFDYDPALGETQERGQWVRGGTDGRLKGKRVCGKAEVWLNGIDFADRGQPANGPDGIPRCCCPPSGECGEPPQNSRGGQEEGGTSTQGIPPQSVSIGGQAEGGKSVQGPRSEQASVGGQAEGGKSAAVYTAGQFSRGGQAEGGLWLAPNESHQISSGGQAEGGNSAAVFAAGQFSRGGQAEGGETQHNLQPRHAVGGCLVLPERGQGHPTVLSTGGTAGTGETTWSQRTADTRGGTVVGGGSNISQGGRVAAGRHWSGGRSTIIKT